MNKFLKYTFVGCLALGLATSCSDDQLETTPTQDIAGTAMEGNASNAMISLNGIYRLLYTAGWSVSQNFHQASSLSHHNLYADVEGDDCIMSAMGDGWFWYDAAYNTKSLIATNFRAYDLWSGYYTLLQNANYIIKNDASMDQNDTDMKFVMGQAYGIRAFSYFMLAQNFARTYKGHESDPCVPIYTEPTEAGTQGKPRATVAEVYEQIVADINKAVEYLDASQNTTIAKSNEQMGLYTALGIKARIALTMEDWDTAAKAAEAVINSGKYTIQDIDASTFVHNGKNFCNTASSKNVIWGAAINTEQAGKYGSFFTHMDADQGKYGLKARKQINKELYSKMSATDTRRCWWNPEDPENKEGGYQQEKFKFSDGASWLGDYVWMRIEEMYLTAAEAECMLGHDPQARQYLLTYMSHRDPNYTTDKIGTAMGKLTSDATGSLREEIIKQRRIELWGEYGRIYDIRRLHQGFRRTSEQSWPKGLLLSNRPTDNPESYMWVQPIPQKEFDGNASLDQKTDQNPLGDLK